MRSEMIEECVTIPKDLLPIVRDRIDVREDNVHLPFDRWLIHDVYEGDYEAIKWIGHKVIVMSSMESGGVILDLNNLKDSLVTTDQEEFKNEVLNYISSEEYALYLDLSYGRGKDYLIDLMYKDGLMSYCPGLEDAGVTVKMNVGNLQEWLYGNMHRWVMYKRFGV